MFKSRDFPGGPVVKNVPSSVGDAGLILGQGTKILHVTRQARASHLEKSHTQKQRKKKSQKKKKSVFLCKFKRTF